MALHRSSGRWRLGLALALVTAGFWATLPAALKIALDAIDPWTLTWIRFLFAFVVLATWLGLRGGLAAFQGLSRGHWLLLGLAAIALTGNYVLYLLGLGRTTPGNAQLLIQAAPLLMALGGLWLFRERYGAWQWLGMAGIVAGLGLFFADQVRTRGEAGYVTGSVLVLFAAIAWAVYALAQKQLLNRLGSAAILLAIYLFASLALWPLADPGALLGLRGLPLLMVAYACINTLGAYGAFAEALAHWEASRVSAVLALTPLLAVATVETVHALAPELIAAERITTLGWIGAAMVVTGSAMTSLLRHRAAELPLAPDAGDDRRPSPANTPPSSAACRP
ncbi:MAG: DMT family transporter [Xanthomonadales bacterium]|nr:DMT family transporter [Xanthomonadales bacterium]